MVTEEARCCVMSISKALKTFSNLKVGSKALEKNQNETDVLNTLSCTFFVQLEIEIKSKIKLVN